MVYSDMTKYLSSGNSKTHVWLWSALQAAIEAAKAQGGTPFFVGATAGTTVTGAFDPLEPIVNVSQSCPTSPVTGTPPHVNISVQTTVAHQAEVHLCVSVCVYMPN